MGFFEEFKRMTEEQKALQSTPFLGNASEHARYLLEKARLLQEQQEFKVYDAVVWKPGLKNMRFPAEGEPCIITAIAPGQMDEKHNSATTQYRAAKDIRLLIVIDNELEEIWCDQRRFCLFVPDEENNKMEKWKSELDSTRK